MLLLNLIAALVVSGSEPVIPITNADGLVMASGVVLNAFTVLTAAHAVGPERSAVFLTCGTVDVVGLVTKRAPATDLALITLMQPCRQLPFVELADKAPDQGDEVDIAGYPASKLHFCKGTVKGYGLFEQRQVSGAFWIAMLVAADVRPGNSGGPVLSKNGKLVGIVHGFHTHAEGKPAVVIPLNAVAQFLAEGSD